MALPWPLFDLRLRTPRLELRPPTDDDLVGLVEASGDIHDPATMPFTDPWTRLASPEREWKSLRWWWSQRANLTPEKWSIALAVIVDGRPIGVQDVMAAEFPVRRTVETGSWIGRAFQGQGLGREMRAAVLELAFAHLGARLATTAAWHDNPASLGVTRALGYVEDGESLGDREGTADRLLRFRIDRARWEACRSVPVEVEGLEPCLRLLGLVLPGEEGGSEGVAG